MFIDVGSVFYFVSDPLGCKFTGILRDSHISADDIGIFQGFRRGRGRLGKSVDEVRFHSLSTKIFLSTS